MKTGFLLSLALLFVVGTPVFAACPTQPTDLTLNCTFDKGIDGLSEPGSDTHILFFFTIKNHAGRSRVNVGCGKLGNEACGIGGQFIQNDNRTETTWRFGSQRTPFDTQSFSTAFHIFGGDDVDEVFDLEFTVGRGFNVQTLNGFVQTSQCQSEARVLNHEQTDDNPHLSPGTCVATWH